MSQTQTQTLPGAFADLAPWVERYALDTEQARNARRVTSELADLQAFYDAMLGRMDAVMDHLLTVPNDNPPAPERTLAALASTFMEVSLAVELFKSPTVPEGFDWRRFEILM